MFKNWRILSILLAVLLLGAGCNANKVDIGKTVGDTVATSTDGQIGVSYTVEKQENEEKKQVNEIKKEPEEKTTSAVQIKITPVSEESAPKDKVVKPTPKTVVIDIAGFTFSPAVVKIKVGDTVKWTNSDDAPHKVASNPHPSHTDLPGLVSGVLSKGESFSFTFDKVGTWGYHCHIHPSMSGMVIVE